MEFTKLFDINITHDYYGGSCRAVKCVPLASAFRTLKAGALRVLAQESQYSVFFEGSQTSPLKKLKSAQLHFAIVAQNTTFASISDTSNNRRNILVYRNAPQVSALSNAESYVLASGIQTYEISQSERPVTLSLRNSNNDIVDQHIISEENGLEEFSFLLKQYPFGLYSITEETASDILLSKFAYVESIPPATIAILQIDVNDIFYSAPASFTLNFSARSEILNYYIVASNYDNNDIQALTMKDAGFTEQSRTQILFNKLESTNFTDQQIAPDLLNKNNAKVVLFTSQSAVSRRQYSPKKLQLMLNNEVLIASLPIPGSSSVSADFFIHVAKA